jgi:hypothetical protein
MRVSIKGKSSFIYSEFPLLSHICKLRSFRISEHLYLYIYFFFVFVLLYLFYFINMLHASIKHISVTIDAALCFSSWRERFIELINVISWFSLFLA